MSPQYIQDPANSMVHIVTGCYGPQLKLRFELEEEELDDDEVVDDDLEDVEVDARLFFGDVFLVRIFFE